MLLIDADIICYRVGFACQKTWYYLLEEGRSISDFEGKTALNNFLKENKLEESDFEIASELKVEPVENAYHSINMMMKTIIDEVGEKYYRAYLTGKNNFRTTIYPAYKGGRKERPVLYQEIREYLINHWSAEVIDCMEADDMLGILQSKNPEDSIIASIDKDLDTIIGWHYNFVTKEKYFVTPEQAELCLYTQMLTGDSSDNVCGIRGIGSAKAKKILQGEEPEALAMSEYKKFYGKDWKEAWDCNYKLLRILNEKETPFV